MPAKGAPDFTVAADGLGRAGLRTVLVTVDEGARAPSPSLLLNVTLTVTPAQPLFTPVHLSQSVAVSPPGPFALLISVLRQLTVEPSLTLTVTTVTLSANHELEGELAVTTYPGQHAAVITSGFPSRRNAELRQAAEIQRCTRSRALP
jgi:hypothetical protein